jgi:hypothetical protein
MHNARPVLALLAALATFASVSAEPPQRVVNIAMEDQFKSRHETGTMRGDVVVLVYAERKGAEAAQELGRRLHVHFHPTAQQSSASEWGRQPVISLPSWPAGVRMPDVRVIAVASLPELPRAMHPVARAQVRKDSPHVPVWLDFEGRLEHTFGVNPGKPNIVLLNTSGEVHAVLSGSIDDVKLREIVTTIDGLRQQSLPAQRTAAVPTGLSR